MFKFNELRKIKKVYGEKFMQMCRRNFSTILEKEGLLYEILTSIFSKNCKTLYEDIIEEGLEEKFKNYIYSKFYINEVSKTEVSDETPYEIMDKVGYTLYECKVESEIQEFKKYYRQDEELCTFKGGRLNKCVVFFAVKKNVDEIRREDFSKPKREDEYGTSVIGIQFDKIGMCTVSIKNRYNHTVNNPDATFGNDLERISPGLSNSFAKLLKEKYELELDTSNIEKLVIPNYVVANDGKYYKYNMEINGVYYCPGNIIIENGEPKELENPESQILIDYFILDIKNKTIRLYDDSIEDSFIETFELLEGSKIIIEKNKERETKIIKIEKDGKEYITIEIDRNNQIIGYKNKIIKKIGSAFLHRNTKLKNLELPELQDVGDDFLYFNDEIEELELHKLENIGNFFLYRNEKLVRLELPEVKQVGDYFLLYNESLKELDLPKLKQAGEYFLWNNGKLNRLYLPELEQVGNNFLCVNTELVQLELPKLKKAGNNFLCNTEKLIRLEIPELQEIGDNCLLYNESLIYVSIPKLPFLEKRILKNARNMMMESSSVNISMSDITRYSLSQGITLDQVEKSDEKKILKNNELIKI